MQILGFDIKKSQKNAMEVTNDVTTKRISLSDMIRGNGKLKISRDVFYELYIRNGDIRACVRDIAKRVGVKGMYLEKKGQPVEGNIKAIMDIFKCPTWLDFKVELLKHLKV